MKTLLKLEQLGQLLLSIFLFQQLDYAWWWYLALFLAPDISMIGYVAGPVVGAWTYNLFHHKGVAIAVYIIGAVLSLPLLQLAGVIMLGHSAFDRLLGYGLKHEDSFSNTHLGLVGKKAKQ